jgi:hypothetical protein
MLGQWKLKNGVYAEVDNYNALIYTGVIFISGYKVPSFWDKEGNSVEDTNYDLVRKRRSKEEYWEQDDNNTIKLICPNCKQVLQVRK